MASTFWVACASLALLATYRASGNLNEDEHVIKDMPKNSLRHVVSLSSGGSLPVCNMTLDNYTHYYMRHLVDMYAPNFIRFRIKFSSNSSFIVRRTPEVIRPYEWVWTYYSPHGFFPYLKWPPDFGLLSFGLLDSKSLPRTSEPYVLLHVLTKNCTITLGEYETMHAISSALKNFLSTSTAFSSYFCYLSEVPEVKASAQYKLNIYFGYAIEFARYKCCRTIDNRLKNPGVHCMTLNGISLMWAAFKLPYILGLLTFAFIPTVLFRNGDKQVNLSYRYRQRFHGYEEAGSLEDQHGCTTDIVYLDGSPPIHVWGILSGACGLQKRHPAATSRFRRLVFVLGGPLVIFIQLYVYYHYEKDLAMAMLDHGYAMGYLSMLAGYERSKGMFLPWLGGPYLVLGVYYLSGILFIVLPSRPEEILHTGTKRYTSCGENSPLLLDPETVETLSPLRFTRVVGYSRVSMMSRSMFYMILNPDFWKLALQIQFDRFNIQRSKSVICTACICLVLPLYAVCCLVEMLMCVIYYGIPMVNCISIAFTGYVVSVLKLPRRLSTLSCIFRNNILRYLAGMVILLLFAYCTCSFCSIFVSSFEFVAKVMVFSFLAVLAYPSQSFGYFFFGIVFIYYIFKICEGFGQIYFELLADAVEISSQLQHDMNRQNVINGTIIIDSAREAEISRLQVRGHVIDLTESQRGTIRRGFRSEPLYVFRKDDMDGIPSTLFQLLVQKYRPVYQHLAHAFLKILLILSLILVTTSIARVNEGSSVGLSEMMHVVFVIAIGALPRILEVAMDTMNYSAKKDIEVRKLTRTIIEYWTECISNNDRMNNVLLGVQ